MEEILKKITEFAGEAHGRQTRKYSPELYIDHPIRVMKTCRKYEDRIEILAAALLHDVVEDTPVSNLQIEEFLQAMLPQETTLKIVKLVEELTDVYIKEDFLFLDRRERKLLEADRLQKVSSDAQTIKYADIIDNAQDVLTFDPGFAAKYLRELKLILELANNGNKELFKIANKIVDDGIGQLR